MITFSFRSLLLLICIFHVASFSMFRNTVTPQQKIEQKKSLITLAFKNHSVLELVAFLGMSMKSPNIMSVLSEYQYASQPDKKYQIVTKFYQTKPELFEQKFVECESRQDQVPHTMDKEHAVSLIALEMGGNSTDQIEIIFTAAGITSQESATESN